MKLFISFLFLFPVFVFAQNPEVTRTLKVPVPIEVAGYHFEVQQSFVPVRDLAEVTLSVVEHETISQVTLSFDDRSQDLLQEVRSRVSGVRVREVSEDKLNDLVPATEPSLSRREQNGFRMLLVIRCIGLGAGLYVGTGSSLSIAAYAGLFNYLLMEALYIPKLNGRMPGVDFVNRLIRANASVAQKIKPDLTPAQRSVVEGFTNFSVNYSMNLIMLIPFLGMTGADFSQYLHAFATSEIYTRSALIAVATTFFMSSWKMAASHWEEARLSGKSKVISAGNQSRIVNSIDFVFSFINPGFWAGHMSNQVLVSTIGAGGFVAYFYYDLKNKFYSEKTCDSLF